MANRRMFSKTITSSSQFLMMPQSSQNLYFHLGMNADDDGFCEHFTVMRMTESKPDDLRVLQSKDLVKVFDDKVLIITNWKENNQIRPDRYTPSKYLALYKEEISKLSSGIPNGNQMATQVSIGKVSIVKDIDNTNVSSLGELNSSLGKNKLLRIIRVYSHLWKDFYGTDYKVLNYGRIGKTLKPLFENYSEIQIAAFLCLHFNWYGATGQDQFSYNSIMKAGFPIDWLPRYVNIYEAYLRNTLKINLDNPEEVKKYIQEVIHLQI